MRAALGAGLRVVFPSTHAAKPLLLNPAIRNPLADPGDIGQRDEQLRIVLHLVQHTEQVSRLCLFLLVIVLVYEIPALDLEGDLRRRRASGAVGGLARRAEGNHDATS